MKLSTNIRGTLLALVGGIGWGFSGACAQYAFNTYDVDPLWASAFRMICAGLLLGIISFAVFRPQFCALWKRPATVLHMALFAIFGLAFCQITYLVGISYSNAATITVIQYAAPVIIVAYACVRDKRAPFFKEVLCILLVIAGVFLIATHGDPGNLALSEQALFWALISCFAYALYTLLPGTLMVHYGSMPVVASGLLIAGAVMAAIVQPWNNAPTMDASGWIVLVGGLVLCGTVISFSSYFQAVKDIGATKTSLIASIETVSATFFSVAWLGVALSPIDIVGFVLIVATVFILARKEKRPAQGEAQ